MPHAKGSIPNMFTTCHSPLLIRSLPGEVSFFSPTQSAITLSDPMCSEHKIKSIEGGSVQHIYSSKQSLFTGDDGAGESRKLSTGDSEKLPSFKSDRAGVLLEPWWRTMIRTFSPSWVNMDSRIEHFVNWELTGDSVRCDQGYRNRSNSTACSSIPRAVAQCYKCHYILPEYWPLLVLDYLHDLSRYPFPQLMAGDHGPSDIIAIPRSDSNGIVN